MTQASLQGGKEQVRAEVCFVEKLLEFSWLFYSRVMGRRVAWLLGLVFGEREQLYIRGLAVQLAQLASLLCDRQLAAMWSCPGRETRFLIFPQSANAKRFDSEGCSACLHMR